MPLKEGYRDWCSNYYILLRASKFELYQSDADDLGIVIPRKHTLIRCGANQDSRDENESNGCTFLSALASCKNSFLLSCTVIKTGIYISIMGPEKVIFLFPASQPFLYSGHLV
jgi:hypothetical protein